MSFLRNALVFVLTALSLTTFSQNKTLAVGTPSPNPNAALHVESPGSNQGFIMPRLTSAQRTAPGFQGVLTTTDIGLLVYDTDLKAIYIWDGVKWGSAAKLALPYVDTVSTAPNGSNLFRIVYSGTAPGNVGVAHFENLNPNSGFSAIFGRTTSATNGVADFIVNNPANNNDGIGVSTNGAGTAIRATTSGSGTAMVIGNNNAGNTNPALQINQAGTGNALQTAGRIQAGQFIGDGSLLTNVSGFSLPRKDSVTAATGTTDLFALKYNNDEPKRVLRIENLNRNNGSSALSVGNNSSGLGLYVQNFNDTTSSSAIMATINSNKLSAVPNPVAIYGESTGEAASAGSFRVTNINNTRAALFAEHLGTGPGVVAIQMGANGNAAYFEVNKNGNGGSALYARTNGTGAAVSALSTGSGPSSAAIRAEHNNNGIAIEAANGGLVFGVFDVTTLPSTLNSKHATINLTLGDAINALTLGTTDRTQGETITFVSTASTPCIINGLGPGASLQYTMSPNEIKTAIFVGGQWVMSGMIPPP